MIGKSQPREKGFSESFCRAVALMVMMQHAELTLLLSAAIGMSLGLLGGGGSILAVPMLVYVAGMAPSDAVGMSLAIVGATSIAASVAHARSQGVDFRVALSFGGSGVVTAFLGARATKLVPPQVLLLLFAGMMVGVGIWMLVSKQNADAPEGRARPLYSFFAGAGVGAVTGFLGVGGGFLIVPALTTFAGLGMRQAVGTSLIVIAINSAAGFLGHLGAGDLHPRITVLLTAISALGALAGAYLSRLVSPNSLRRGFSIIVILVGVAVAALR